MVYIPEDLKPGDIYVFRMKNKYEVFEIVSRGSGCHEGTYGDLESIFNKYEKSEPAKRVIVNPKRYP